MTGCHHELRLVGSKLSLLEYYREHHYFICHPEIRGTGFLSGYHTHVISNSSIEEQTVSLLYFHTHLVSFHTLQALLSRYMWSSIQHIVNYNQAIINIKKTP